MASDVVAVVLAAGKGTRLAPLTDLRPKALCPVANVALLDHALSNAGAVSDEVAVNAHHHWEQIADHVDGRSIHFSHEEEPLGTAGALGNLKQWIDGRAVLVHNSDSWHRQDLRAFFDSWDGQRPRLMVTPAGEPSDFGNNRFCGVSLLPWWTVQKLDAVPSGLWEVSWRQLWHEGEIDLFVYKGDFFDCGTPGDYLHANLVAAGSDRVIGPGATVLGTVSRSVVWSNAYVGPEEELIGCVRTDSGLTVNAEEDANP